MLSPQRRCKYEGIAMQRGPQLFAISLFVSLLTAIALGQVSPVDALQATTESDEEKVGRAAEGRTVTPVNQLVTPFGRQVHLPGMRPQAVALSPNGRLLVT
jgi:hypothetical protein